MSHSYELARLARGGVPTVSSVSAFSSFPFYGGFTGHVNLLGFYVRGDGGGGEFYWDPSRPKSQHDGGTIIDPNKSGVLGSVATVDYFTPSGSGVGCWVRVHDTGNLNIKWFGAKGDGSSNTAVSLTACFAAGVAKKIFFPSGTYFYSSSVTFPDVGFVSIENSPNTVHVCGPMSTFFFFRNMESLEIKGGTFDGTAVSGWVFTSQASNPDVPMFTKFVDMDVISGGATGDNRNGGACFFVCGAPEITRFREIRIENCRFRSTSGNGVGIFTNGPGGLIEQYDTPFKLLVKNCVFDNFGWGIYSNECSYQMFEGNRVVRCRDYGLTARNRRYDFLPVGLDPDQLHGVFITNNEVDMTARGDSGIVIGKGAGPCLVSHNLVYGRKIGGGIIIDAALGSTGQSLGGGMSSRTRAVNNVVKNFDSGIYSNGSDEVIQDNTVSGCVSSSIRVKGNSAQTGKVISGNFLRDAGIIVATEGDTAGELVKELFVSNNFFLDIDRCVRYDGGLGAAYTFNLNTRNSIAVSTLVQDINWYFLLNDAYSISTDQGDATILLPSPGIVGVGKSFSIFHRDGTNRIRCAPYIVTLSNVSGNSFTLSSDLRGYYVTGYPIRLRKRSPSDILPTPLLENVPYYLISNGGSSWSLAVSKENALANIPISFSNSGSNSLTDAGDLVVFRDGSFDKEMFINNPSEVFHGVLGTACIYVM